MSQILNNIKAYALGTCISLGVLGTGAYKINNYYSLPNVVKREIVEYNKMHKLTKDTLHPEIIQVNAGKFYGIAFGDKTEIDHYNVSFKERIPIFSYEQFITVSVVSRNVNYTTLNQIKNELKNEKNSGVLVANKKDKIKTFRDYLYRPYRDRKPRGQLTLVRPGLHNEDIMFYSESDLDYKIERSDPYYFGKHVLECYVSGGKDTYYARDCFHKEYESDSEFNKITSSSYINSIFKNCSGIPRPTEFSFGQLTDTEKQDAKTEYNSLLKQFLKQYQNANSSIKKDYQLKLEESKHNMEVEKIREKKNLEDELSKEKNAQKEFRAKFE